MGQKLKISYLFIIISTFILYGVTILYNMKDESYIFLAINGLISSLFIFLNRKYMTVSKKNIYLFVLWASILRVIGDLFYVIVYRYFIKNPNILTVASIFYMISGFVIVFLGIFILVNNFKKIDKKQFIMDFSAILIFLYNLFISAIKGIFEGKDIMSISNMTNLPLDISLITVTALIISTFRSEKLSKAMMFNLIAFIIYFSLDLIYLYIRVEGIYTDISILELIYAMPVILFAISSSMTSNKKEKKNISEFGIETPLNYGNSSAIIMMFLILICIKIILYQNGKITYNEIGFIFSIVFMYLILSLNYQNIIKNKMELKYHIKINDNLESRVYERTQELEIKNKQLLTIVNTDILTELGSRKYLIDILDSHEVSYLNRDIALFVIDIVQFKNINNISGNRIGDMVLREVAERLVKLFPKDKLFRTDSNEFVVLLESKASNENMLEFLAKDITNALTSTMYVDTYRINLNIAIGCAKYPGCDIKDFGELLTNAEYASKEVKKDYKTYNNYRLYNDDMAQSIKRKTNIESLLQTINYDEEFIMHFQPQFTVDGSELVGMESLIRWNSPILGFVSPGEFIPIAESTNIIIKIVQWTLIKAIDVIKYWNEKYDLNCKISINISPKYIESYDFLNEVKYFIDSKGVNPSWLDFEITEMTVMQVGDSVIKLFEDLHSMGINISIDDFGTGYSSLSYIKNFKVNKLKIAKELIDNITTDKNEYMIVNAIIMMANGLNLKTIAEGAEIKEQKDILEELGCNQIQGYYYGRPVPAREFEKLYLRSIEKMKEKVSEKTSEKTNIA